MSCFSGVEHWTVVLFASGLGFLTWWVSQSRGSGENAARAAAYTTGMFILLVIELRPAWRRFRFWVDLLVMLALHVVVVLPLVNLLDAHSIRLNWAIALPFIGLEILLFLGFLWRRNVGDSWDPHAWA
jgi:hypothetical protein